MRSSPIGPPAQKRAEQVGNFLLPDRAFFSEYSAYPGSYFLEVKPVFATDGGILGFRV
jgi:hypothetical protein